MLIGLLAVCAHPPAAPPQTAVTALMVVGPDLVAQGERFTIAVLVHSEQGWRPVEAGTALRLDGAPVVVGTGGQIEVSPYEREVGNVWLHIRWPDSPMGADHHTTVVPLKRRLAPAVADAAVVLGDPRILRIRGQGLGLTRAARAVDEQGRIHVFGDPVGSSLERIFLFAPEEIPIDAHRLELVDDDGTVRIAGRPWIDREAVDLRGESSGARHPGVDAHVESVGLLSKEPDARPVVRAQGRVFDAEERGVAGVGLDVVVVTTEGLRFSRVRSDDRGWFVVDVPVKVTATEDDLSAFVLRPLDFPWWKPPRTPARCKLEANVLGAAGIKVSPVEPVQGAGYIPADEPMPLIIGGADVDVLEHGCTCYQNNEPTCRGTAFVDVEDSVGYGWSILEGPGQLLHNEGPATFLALPDVPVGARTRIRIRGTVADSRGNDKEAYVIFNLQLERIDCCSYRRVVDIEVHEDPGQVPAGQFSCACEPEEAVWQKGAELKLAQVEIPPIVCAGQKVRFRAMGGDEDDLALACSSNGMCGYDEATLSLVDEVKVTWQANRGGFPDHHNGPLTLGAASSMIYLPPQTPGKALIIVSLEDQNRQWIDREDTVKQEITVVRVDFEVKDVGEAGGGRVRTGIPPCPTPAVRVDDRDNDADCRRDYVDGMDGTVDGSPAWAKAALTLHDPIDLQQATVRFEYDASDPPGGATPAGGFLRLWLKDGPAARNPADVEQGGDFVRAGVEYRARDLGFAGGRTTEIFIEGIRESVALGAQKIRVIVDADGSGPGVACRKSANTTLARLELVDARTTPGRPENAVLHTWSRPQMTLKDSSAQMIGHGTAQIRIAGDVRDAVADLVAGGRGDITALHVGTQVIAVTRDPLEPITAERPYAFRGTYDHTFEVSLAPGRNEFLIRTTENALGLQGEALLVVEARPPTGPRRLLEITAVRVEDDTPEGCFRPYFLRVHDPKPWAMVEIMGVTRPLVPEGTGASGAGGSTAGTGSGSGVMVATGTPNTSSLMRTKEPFVVVNHRPRLNDPNIHWVKNKDPLPWKYAGLEAAWPATGVVIDGDVDEDGQITEADGVIKGLREGVIVGLNSDDDDRDGIPDGADDNINGAADRADMVRILVRQLAPFDPAAGGQVILRKRPGGGEVRIFKEDGEVLIAPGRLASRNLWDDVKGGDLPLWVEGVRAGRVVIDNESSLCGSDCKDSLVLTVKGFVLSLDVDEPHLDSDPTLAPDGYFELAADHTVPVPGAAAPVLGLDLIASFMREDERADPDKEIEDRTIKWLVHPLGNEGANDPRLGDHHDAAFTLIPREIQTRVITGYSWVMLDHSFRHPVEGRPWARAGDRFRVTVEANTPLGERLTRDLFIRVVPGAKTFHVTNPPPTFSPAQAWRLSDRQIETVVSDSRFDVPVGSAQKGSIVVYPLDTYRNLLRPGTPVQWSLQGGGMLGTDPTNPNPIPQGGTAPDIAAEVDGNGSVRVGFTQMYYPSCPWQNQPGLEPSSIHLQVDGFDVEVNKTDVVRTGPLVDVLGPLRVKAIPFPGTITRDCLAPDIANKPSCPFSVRVFREVGSQEVPVRGVAVNFTSLNGHLDPLDGRAVTDGRGIATIYLTAENAEEGNIRIIAGVGSVRDMDVAPNLRWNDTRPIRVKADRKVIAGNAVSDGSILVDTLTDRGERRAVPGAVEGDGQLRLPYVAGTTLRVRGIPNHVYHVDIRDDLSWGDAARYPLDLLTPGNITPDVIQSRDAAVTGARLDPSIRKEGLASMAFHGSDRITLPGSPAADLRGAALVRMWVRPHTLDPALLLDRVGQYRLEVVGSGRIRFTGTGGGGVISDTPLQVGVWNLVELRVDATGVRLGVGSDAQDLDYTIGTPVVLPAVAVGTPVVVGQQFQGHIDDIRFVKNGDTPAPVTAIGLLPGSTVRTDAQGEASFTIRSTGQWPSRRFEPVRVVVEIAGSQGAQTEIWVAPKELIGRLLSAGKAFLTGPEGVGEDAGWLEEASAFLSEMIPFASDLRTIAFEITKAAVGCDSVDMLNVTFAVVGLVGDALSFGTVGTAVRGTRAIFKTVAKRLLREITRNVAQGAAMHLAVSGFLQVTSQIVLAVRQTGTTEPPWIARTQPYLESLTTWSREPQTREGMTSALTSANDAFYWFDVHDQMGGVGTRSLLRDIAPLAGGTP